MRTDGHIAYQVNRCVGYLTKINELAYSRSYSDTVKAAKKQHFRSIIDAAIALIRGSDHPKKDKLADVIGKCIERNQGMKIASCTRWHLEFPRNWRVQDHKLICS